LNSGVDVRSKFVYHIRKCQAKLGSEIYQQLLSVSRNTLYISSGWMHSFSLTLCISQADGCIVSLVTSCISQVDVCIVSLVTPCISQADGCIISLVTCSTCHADVCIISLVTSCIYQADGCIVSLVPPCISQADGCIVSLVTCCTCHADICIISLVTSCKSQADGCMVSLGTRSMHIIETVKILRYLQQDFDYSCILEGRYHHYRHEKIKYRRHELVCDY
jgi:hypothetical protein